MEIQTQAKYIHISPKKLRETARLMVGLSTQEALDRLQFSATKAGKIIAKVIDSAIANVVSTAKLSKEKLKIKSIQIGKGPFYKRWQPVSRGMAHQIKKRTSHIKVILEELKSPK